MSRDLKPLHGLMWGIDEYLSQVHVNNSLRCSCPSSSIQRSNCVPHSVTRVKMINSLHCSYYTWSVNSSMFVNSINCCTDLIHYALISLSLVLWTSLCGLRSAMPALWASVAWSASFCARDAHKCFMCLYWSLAHYNIFTQWNIINSLSCSSHLSYGAASLLCSTFKINVFWFYGIYIYI